MNIALMAHDAKKELMIQFCSEYCGVLSKNTLCATGTTGKMVSLATGLEITKYLSGNQGGSQQILARIAYNEIDLLIFFRDPFVNRANEVNDIEVLKVCDMQNIPVATNSSTAEILIHELEQGRLQSNIIDESKKYS